MGMFLNGLVIISKSESSDSKRSWSGEGARVDCADIVDCWKASLINVLGSGIEISTPL